MSDTVNICLPCGLCCDGTLIGHVQLENDELDRLRKFKEIEEEGGKGFFLQPCNDFCNGACSVYSQRPKQCASFECGLLKAVNLKELSFSAALDITQLVKQKKASIEAKVLSLQIKLQSQSFHFKMTELKIYLLQKKSNASFTPQDKLLLNEVNELNDLLTDKFDVSFK